VSFKRPYICCQIAALADEQWLAWVQAAQEDGKSTDYITPPLECDGTEIVAPIVIRHTRNRGFRDFATCVNADNAKPDARAAEYQMDPASCLLRNGINLARLRSQRVSYSAGR
jgi:hypothetical protein